MDFATKKSDDFKFILLLLLLLLVVVVVVVSPYAGYLQLYTRKKHASGMHIVEAILCDKLWYVKYYFV